MERLTIFTSSRGILKSCDHFNAFPISSSSGIDEGLIEKHAAGQSIYICTDALINFATQILPKIAHPFVLVSGDSDTTIDEKFVSNEIIKSLLNDSKLIQWFAQNSIVEHPKLSSIPIGLDYHTMNQNETTWGISKQSPVSQEHTLIEIFSKSDKFEDRFFAGYCNWHFHINRGDREDCLNKINKEISLIERNPVSRISTWQRQAECMFVISPEGAGMDCHRTWEAILLGCIPVVKKSKLNLKLLNNLPVVFLEDWDDFKPDHMLSQIIRFREEKFNFNPLFNSFWKEKIKGKEVSYIPPMTINEFRKFICKKSF